MISSGYMTPLLYRRGASYAAWMTLLASFVLQSLLVAHAAMVINGLSAILFLAILALGMLVGMGSVGFVLLEALKDKQDYRPRFRRELIIHLSLNLGLCATAICQVIAYSNDAGIPAYLRLPVAMEVVTTLLPLILATYAGAYVLINTRKNNPAYIEKYGYGIPKKKKRIRRPI